MEIKAKIINYIHSLNEKFKTQYLVKEFDLWALGITIVIGGQYFGWNAGLSSGFGSMAIATCLMGSAYVGLILSVSEISSALPFAGGAYGLARCSVGFYPGFLVGCFEAFEYVIYVATSAVSLGTMICELLGLSVTYQPLIWFLFYVSALSIQIIGGRAFWYCNNTMAIVSLLILLIYCFGSCQYINYDKYTPYIITDDTINSTTDKGMFVGGMYEFMKIFPLAAWFYVGVESIPFAADKVDNPKKVIPMGMITCVLTLFSTSLLVYFITCGIPPGVEQTSSTLAVFNSGFSKMFNLTDKQVLVLSLPATYATAFGFIFPYGKLIEALSDSKLLPRILGTKTIGVPPETKDYTRESRLSSHHSNSHISANDEEDKSVKSDEEHRNSIDVKSTPYVAMLIGSGLGYFICLLQYYCPYIGLQLFNICILSAFLAYITQCVGYIVLLTKFKTIKREFHSPFGIFGAIYSALIFSIGVVSVIYFQTDNHFAIYVFMCMTGLLSCYYYGYASKKQTFSKAEQKILFVAHVITYNGAKRRQSQMKAKKRPSHASVPSNLSYSSTNAINSRKVSIKHNHNLARVVPIASNQLSQSNNESLDSEKFTSEKDLLGTSISTNIPKDFNEDHDSDDEKVDDNIKYKKLNKIEEEPHSSKKLSSPLIIRSFKD
mmetsp:Transcript_15041/g.13588  ORF Transcript_15041/g.13588 Transcript_15041/m.13588 type:complete len:661 (+) Transcript_15041:84-2066(+)